MLEWSNFNIKRDREQNSTLSLLTYHPTVCLARFKYVSKARVERVPVMDHKERGREKHWEGEGLAPLVPFKHPTLKLLSAGAALAVLVLGVTKVPQGTFLPMGESIHSCWP